MIRCIAQVNIQDGRVYFKVLAQDESSRNKGLLYSKNGYNIYSIGNPDITSAFSNKLFTRGELHHLDNKETSTSYWKVSKTKNRGLLKALYDMNEAPCIVIKNLYTGVEL